MKLLAEDIQNLELKLKNTKMSQGQRPRAKCQKFRINSNVIVTDILIKPQQFKAGSLDPWPWNWTMT